MRLFFKIIKKMSENIYTTPEKVKFWVINSDLKKESDELIKILIIQAQFLIDANIWKINSFSSSQEFKFPINSNWKNVIPADIEMATNLLVEELYINKDNRNIKSENWEWYGVSYKEQKESLPKNVQDLLKKYNPSFYKLSY